MHIRSNVVSSAVLLIAAGSAQAQQGELYLVDIFNTQSIYVVQNGAVQRSWSIAIDGTRESAIAVAGTVRTRPFGTSGNGREYDLFGVQTGPVYPASGPNDDNYDGTTDGAKFNFSGENGFGTTTVYAHDRDWQNQTPLFTVNNGPQAFSLGVTYDPTNNSLWLTHDGNGSNRMANYDMAGTLLSEFTFNDGVGGRPGMVAYEPQSDTLWFGVENTSNIQQYDKAGNLLQTISVNGLPSAGWYSGEFNMSVPAPGAAALVGAAGLIATRRRRA